MTPHLGPEDFDAFYHELYGYAPYPWQRILAERVANGEWPTCIDLPTASGKTSSIDIAVFALACQADRPVEERTAPRRIFFVVDRRIVVDGAYSHAEKLASALAKAESGTLRTVADRLRLLAADPDAGAPLLVTRMRGGIALDDGWVRDPSRPAVITSTVDQAGSRLLFRGYGRTRAVAPIDAGLVGNDALFIVDEAHCAVPFSQTLSAVQNYRAPRWAEHPVPSPFQAVIMSATPPDGVPAVDVFPAPDEADHALDSPYLARRIEAVKRTELAPVRTPRRPRKGQPGLRGKRLSKDRLVLDAADRALKASHPGPSRVAVMVNRVATARAVWKQIRAGTRAEDGIREVDVVLMTGRMRPYDRDRIVERWTDLLAARDEPAPLERSVILVTTQCLEVGADFSFDALITECASLDALRQRFGRHDRLGTAEETVAAILIRRQQIRTTAQIERLEDRDELHDPIYGNALARTWNWLNEHATEDEDGTAWIDMGTAGLEEHFPADLHARRELLSQLSAPAPEAPALLPAHLDLWVQTSPRPRPDPEIAQYLHGPGRNAPEVSVVVRQDLLPVPEYEGEAGAHPWIHAVSLLPPTTPETFSVPLGLVQSWVRDGQADPEALSDVEGAPIEGEELETERTGLRHVVLWRGRDRSVRTADANEIRPGEIVVIPGLEALPEAFGDIAEDEEGHQPLDIAEAAFQEARSRVTLRVQRKVLDHWKDDPTVKPLLVWADEPDRDVEPEELDEILEKLAEGPESPDELGLDASAPGAPGTDPMVVDATVEDAGAPGDDEGDAGDDTPEIVFAPAWLRTAARVLAAGCEITPHPCGGYVLTSRTPIEHVVEPEEDAFADGDDLWSAADEPVTLSRHHADAVDVLRTYAALCVPPSLAGPMVRAMGLHDIGKIDPRFQQMLHCGSKLASHATDEPLAKSANVPETTPARRRARELASLPRGFRHEMLSVQLAERYLELADDPAERDLILHLIATHHGYARPFARVVPDDAPPGVEGQVNGTPIHVSADERRGWPAPHALASEGPDRFWRVIQRYGWWGTAFLEALLRLADWTASDEPSRTAKAPTVEPAIAGGES